MRLEEYHPSEIPDKPGVYVFRDRFGEVIYVGKARRLRRRLANYFQPSRRRTADPKTRSLINSIADWNYELVRSDDEALILESRLIKDYAPRYNILMRDDKRYMLLELDPGERFPTLRTARFKRSGDLRYYGPFPHGYALKMTLEYLLAHFGLRACRDSAPDEETRKRCLKRIVKDCCGPCTGKVSEAEYREHLDAALKVLEGDISELKAELAAGISECAASENFEKAARLRDVLDNLVAVFGRRNRSFERPELPGAVSGPSAAEALRERLGLSGTLHRIIGFDISNTFGTQAVASMVVFTDGRPDRDQYRRFRIKTVEHSDDFAMMAEAVGRHFGRLLREKRKLPDLLMVDGGRGQLSAALERLAELKCPAFPVLGLAKRLEEIILPGRAESLRLDRHDPALRLLQALRDEAHRFAIGYHRKLRDRRMEQSALDNIPGVGPKRRKALLEAFGSVRKLRLTAAEELARRVPGLGMATAEKVVAALRG